MTELNIKYDSNGYAQLTPTGQAKGVQVIWVPNARNSGGTYADDGIDYPYRVVWHQIQGGANPDVISNHSSPPHLWYASQKRILYQTVPLSRSAFALYQASNAPYKTNKARAIQIELDGYSNFVASEPIEWLQNIAEDVLAPICSWVDDQGYQINLDLIPPPWVIPGSAYPNAPQRFEPTYWAKFNGTCAHANVPMGDDHWDTGALDIWWIAEHAKLYIAGLLEPQEIEIMPDYILHVGSSNTIDGPWMGVYENGYTRADLTWDEIQFLVHIMKLPVCHSKDAPNPTTRLLYG